MAGAVVEKRSEASTRLTLQDIHIAVAVQIGPVRGGGKSQIGSCEVALAVVEEDAVVLLLIHDHSIEITIGVNVNQIGGIAARE